MTSSFIRALLFCRVEKTKGEQKLNTNFSLFLYFFFKLQKNHFRIPSVVHARKYFANLSEPKENLKLFASESCCFFVHKLIVTATRGSVGDWLKR